MQVHRKAADEQVADAMVLESNETAHHAWDAAGYAREERWRRWVKPLTG